MEETLRTMQHENETVQGLFLTYSVTWGGGGGKSVRMFSTPEDIIIVAWQL